MGVSLTVAGAGYGFCLISRCVMGVRRVRSRVRISMICRWG